MTLCVTLLVIRIKTMIKNLSFYLFILVGCSSCSMSDVDLRDSCGLKKFRNTHKEYFSIIEVESFMNAENKYFRLLSPSQKESINKPFGELNDFWKELRWVAKDSDCLVYVENSVDDWNNLRGRAGYILVRGGKALKAVTLYSN